MILHKRISYSRWLIYISLVWSLFSSFLFPKSILVDGATSSSGSTTFLSSQQTQLPWGDINIIVLTDVHGWVNGQKHLFFDDHQQQQQQQQQQQMVDYGKIVSFYEQLPHDQYDIFFVMNGDFMDGTGLSTIPPTYLLPILEQMPWDAITIGNHELYHTETIQFMKESGFIDHWNGNYVTSNVIWVSTNEPIGGSRYTILHATSSSRQQHNRQILTFGFLFNFQGYCNTTKVLRVQDVIQEDWFHTVLQEETYDAILVLAHMDYEDELVYILQNAIREIVGPTMPIQFINGHSHRRGFALLDNTSSAMEAGHYLDTIGFVSFPWKQTIETMLNSTSSSSLFRYAFMDATVSNLTSALGQKYFHSTKAGIALTKLIQKTRHELGLEQTIGCAPQTYQLDVTLDDPNSLWKLYMDSIIRTELLQQNTSLVYIQGTGLLRYDLFLGLVTLDDIIAVTPFNDSIYSVMDHVEGKLVRRMLQFLETMQPIGNTKFPPFASTLSSKDVIESNFYQLLTSDFDAPRLCQIVSMMIPEMASFCQPVPYQFTTKDFPWNQTIRPVLTTNLWISYIERQWICQWNQQLESKARVLLPIMFLFVIFALLFYQFFIVTKQSVVELWESNDSKTIQHRDISQPNISRDSFDDDKTPLIQNRHKLLLSPNESVDLLVNSDDLHGNTKHKKASSIIVPQHVLASVLENDASLI